MRKFFAILGAIAPLQRIRALRRWQPYAASDDSAPKARRRGPGAPGEALPGVFTQDVPSRTPDDVVEIIHMQNDTERTYHASVRARFSVTVDDESGAALQHGPRGIEVELAPGERARIGDILGWEWDSAVRRMTIEFRRAGDDRRLRASYNLARRGYERQVAGLGEVYEVYPEEVESLG